MIGHLAPGVECPVVTLATLGQGFQPGFPVYVVAIDVLPPVATRCEVVEPPAQHQSKWARQKESLMGVDAMDAMLQDLTHCCRKRQYETGAHRPARVCDQVGAVMPDFDVRAPLVAGERDYLAVARRDVRRRPA